jgi:hypothetical protein
LASEVLEHLAKHKGKRLLEEIEKVARKMTIITTPHLVGKRGGLRSPEGFNPYERHIEQLTIRELRSAGYRVYGTGFCFLALTPVLNWILSPISFLIPWFSAHLIARKRKGTS